MKKSLGITAISLLFFLGFGGIYGAWMLIEDPSGAAFGFPGELLEGTPFSSYLVPGIILLVFIGLLPVFVAICTLLKKSFSPWLITFQGGILLGWLTIELLINPDFFVPLMHYTSYAIGLLLVSVGIWLLRMKETGSL